MITKKAVVVVELDIEVDNDDIDMSEVLNNMKVTFSSSTDGAKIVKTVVENWEGDI